MSQTVPRPRVPYTETRGMRISINSPLLKKKYMGQLMRKMGLKLFTIQAHASYKAFLTFHPESGGDAGEIRVRNNVAPNCPAAV